MSSLRFVRRATVVTGMTLVPGERQADARQRVQHVCAYLDEATDTYRLVRHVLAADDAGLPALFVAPVDGFEGPDGNAPMTDAGIRSRSEPVSLVCLLAWENLARLVEDDHPAYLASMAVLASSASPC
jgi:hypothetical protein